MHFRLDELQKGKEVTREIDLEREEIRVSSGMAVVQNLLAQLKFRIDPLGYVVKYHVRATVHCDCIRCAGDLQLEMDITDWISLRVRQPEEGHLLLDNSELNVRFITDIQFDMKHFALEVVELEIPSFPRHDENAPECLAVNLEDETTLEEEKKASPFNVLSDLID